MVNAQILPRPINDEFLHRTKYVDDFTDIISSKSFDTLTKALISCVRIYAYMPIDTGQKYTYMYCY